MSKNKRILHIVPDSITKTKKLYVGSTKDIRSRTEYFIDRQYFFEELIVYNRSDLALLRMLKGLDLSSYDVIFFEFALYPLSMIYARIKYPSIKQVVRSINADFYHFMHHYFASLLYPATIFYTRKNFLDFLSFYWIRYAIKRLFLDFICAQIGDVVFSIVEWEKEKYWRYIAKSEKVKNLPYYLPQSYYQEVEQVPKKNQCVCLMSTTEGVIPLLRDAATRFSENVDGLGELLPDWKFFVTGNLSRSKIKMIDRVEVSGLLETPFPLLAESRCMALLSNLGYGFKTKILDAIQSKCYILVLSGLYARLPDEVKPYCIVVDEKSPNSFVSALEQSKMPFPDGDPNQLFKKKAWFILDQVLGE